MLHGLEASKHWNKLKYLLGVKKCTQNDFVYGELGRKPLQCQRLNNIVKFWIKIMQSDDHKYIKIVYIEYEAEYILYT